MKRNSRDKERGSALIFTILILFILSVLGSVLISVAMTNFKLTKHSSDYDTVYYLTDGAAEEVLAEMEILAKNAEFNSLSTMSSYAETIKEDYVTPHLTTETITTCNNGGNNCTTTTITTTTYSYDIDNSDDSDDNYEKNLAEKYEEFFLKEIAKTLFKPITKEYEFDAALGNAFDENEPINIDIISPNASIFKDCEENDYEYEDGDLSDGESIQIKVSGFYNGLQRDIVLDYEIHVPPYSFKGKKYEDEDVHYILYYGYEVRSNTTPGLELVSWMERNINE
ncbi:MAG TPA: pilus assembly PilX N-terminal domain-containing protein [Clostridia bacterium]|nr:pilus assembly PilX N-terminal domain-containing protein [Clostridia bacterium]